MNSYRRKKGNTGKIIIAVGVILVLLYIYYLGCVKCSVSGCDAGRVSGSSYCLYHQYVYETPEYMKHHHTSGTEKSAGGSSPCTGSSGSGPSAGSASGSSSSGSGSSGSHGYSDIASEYSDGEDFVDDWGDDFDSDDEAYEYWEDNHDRE